MASLQTHRKLLPANTTNSNSTRPTDPTVQTCLYFCNSQNKTTSPYSGFCPQVCLAICPSQCHYSLSLPPEFPPYKPNKSQNMSPLLICMLVLLASAFLLIILYILYTKLYYLFYAPHSNSFLQTRTRRRGGRESVGNYSADEEHGNRVVFHPFWYISTAGLPPTDIRSIPIHKYGKEMEERDCGVCLTEFEEGDELRVLPKCNHAFHIPCIDTWLSSHTSCPLCRTPIIPPGDHSRDHDHHHKNEDTPSSLASMEGATGNHSPAEVLSNTIGGVEEEVENNLEDDRKYSKQRSRNIGGSCSQRWSLETGPANLLTRSISCSGKIFLSHPKIKPSPDS